MAPKINTPTEKEMMDLSKEVSMHVTMLVRTYLSMGATVYNFLKSYVPDKKRAAFSFSSVMTGFDQTVAMFLQEELGMYSALTYRKWMRVYNNLCVYLGFSIDEVSQMGLLPREVAAMSKIYPYDLTKTEVARIFQKAYQDAEVGENSAARYRFLLELKKEAHTTGKHRRDIVLAGERYFLHELEKATGVSVPDAANLCDKKESLELIRQLREKGVKEVEDYSLKEN